RAAREIYYWSRMKHKNIHQLMGVIIFKDGYLGMVSEWMENGDLHKYLLKNPGADRYQLVRSQNTAAFLALTACQCIDVASGLEYMHNQGTVHGDLKALNVLVSLEGVARISDFDFSVMSSASGLMFSASSNSRSGSIRWVAPEMFIEDAPKRTKQSDVYALGMTMLEVFTGDFPYPECRMDVGVIKKVEKGNRNSEKQRKITGVGRYGVLGVPAVVVLSKLKVGDFPYPECRMDVGVIKKVEKGTLPPRPTVHLGSDQQGDLVWQLLLNCWSRNLDERPSAGRIREALFFYAAI
ncbi:hypothetical protein RSAG8_13458, partial [Rhizoctonia solani AG-8 WAC10335]